MQTALDRSIKAGFLLYCAEQGMTMAETHQLVKQAIVMLTRREKQAAPWLAPLVTGATRVGSGIGKMVGGTIGALPGLLSTGTMIGVGAPLAVGASGGYLAARLANSENKELLEEAKKEEIIDEYDRLADEAKRRALLKKIQNRTGKRILPLGPSLGV